MEKVLIASKLAGKMAATEASVDAAIEASMAMLSSMAEARKEAGVSPTIGNEATAKIAEAIAILSQARTCVVAAHEELAEVALRMNIRTTMIDSPIINCPQPTGHATVRTTSQMSGRKVA
jgi:hypothetical protein